MNNIGKERIYGFFGTTLPFLIIIPYLGFLPALAGIILLLISLYKFSKKFNDKEVFNKYLIGWIIYFIGPVIAFILGLGSFIRDILMAVLLGNESGMAMLGMGVFLAILIFYATWVISCYFVKQSFERLGKHKNINLFNLAGNFIFWGAVAIILFGLGLIACYVGCILLAAAFYAILQTVEKPPESAITPTPINNP